MERFGQRIIWYWNVEERDTRNWMAGAGQENPTEEWLPSLKGRGEPWRGCYYCGRSARQLEYKKIMGRGSKL